MRQRKIGFEAFAIAKLPGHGAAVAIILGLQTHNYERNPVLYEPLSVRLPIRVPRADAIFVGLSSCLLNNRRFLFFRRAEVSGVDDYQLLRINVTTQGGTHLFRR